MTTIYDVLHSIYIYPQTYAPDFYNWNRVAIRYCDGSSFTGDVEKVDPVRCHRFYSLIYKYSL